VVVTEFRVKASFGSPGPTFPPRDPAREAFARLQQAEQLRLEGELDRAQAICEGLVRQHPSYLAALHTLGLIHLHKGDYQRALDRLVRALMCDPQNWGTLTALSAAYLRLNATEMAAQTLERARAAKPEDVSVLLTLGEIYTEDREYELARDVFLQALTLEADLAPAATGLATACSYLGQFAEAARLLEGMIERGQRSLDVLVVLASLPAAVGVDLLAELGKIAREDYDKAEFESFAAFVQAAGLDRAGRAAEAWEHVVPANRAIFLTRRDELRAGAEWERASLARLRELPVRTEVHASGSDEWPLSLFILGPSRSGKTTMERLVGTLEGVKRGYENPGVDNAVRRTFQTAALLIDRFERLPAEFRPVCCDLYRKELARRAGSAKVFTNTHPGRIHDAALMSSVFPNTRFILLKRNIEDNVLRIFMRRYSRGNAYSYDLQAAYDHVVWYHQMIDLLAQKLPRIVRVITYEDMTADPAGALRIAADLCGLEMPRGPLPPVGDDRGCAQPYRMLMAAGLDR
jgi:Flp pilus assembly protein TadD